MNKHSYLTPDRKVKHGKSDCISIEEVNSCRICPNYTDRIHAVGEGDINANTMIVVDRFTDEEIYSGSVLGDGKYKHCMNILLDAVGLGREDVWITSAVKCSAISRSVGLFAWTEVCSFNWLFSEIRLINPSRLIVFGRDIEDVIWQYVFRGYTGYAKEAKRKPYMKKSPKNMPIIFMEKLGDITGSADFEKTIQNFKNEYSKT
jgi:uracil-DNA glycosylase family 4